MPYQTNTSSSTYRIVLLGLFVAMALALSYFERFIPVTFMLPGVKLGLANIISLLALYVYGPKETVLIVFVRVLLLNLLIGSVTGFFYGLTGGILSLYAMYIAIKLLKDLASPIGISVIGAFFHNLGQVIVLAFVVRNLSIALSYFPIIILTGVVSGMFIGWTVMLSKTHLSKLRFL